MLWKMG